MDAGKSRSDPCVGIGRGVAFVLAAGLLIAGCSGPSVNLATREPIKVDINMRLDVYQHEAEAENNAAADEASDAGVAGGTPETRRRNRMADIQDFKNSRLVGEGKDGLLAIREEPPGEFGDYVRKTVAEENQDRMKVMREMAESQKRPLPEIQAEQAEIWRERSFQNEWIEVPLDDGSYRWVPKEG